MCHCVHICSFSWPVHCCATQRHYFQDRSKRTLERWPKLHFDKNKMNFFFELRLYDIEYILIMINAYLFWEKNISFSKRNIYKCMHFSQKKCVLSSIGIEFRRQWRHTFMNRFPICLILECHFMKCKGHSLILNSGTW